MFPKIGLLTFSMLKTMYTGNVSLHKFNVLCTAYEDSRRVCRTEREGYYALFDRTGDGDPGRIVWYNDEALAREELGADLSAEVKSELRLCVDWRRNVAVATAGFAKDLVYVFAYFDLRRGKLVGLAFPTRRLFWALAGYFGNARDVLSVMALARLCSARLG